MPDFYPYKLLVIIIGLDYNNPEAAMSNIGVTSQVLSFPNKEKREKVMLAMNSQLPGTPVLIECVCYEV